MNPILGVYLSTQSENWNTMIKQCMIVLLVSMIGTTAAMAQREKNTQELFMQMKQELNLSDGQSVQVMAILMDGKRVLDAARADGDISEEERGELRKLRKSTDQQISALLNEDQRKKYSEIKREHRGKLDPRMLKD